MVGTVLLAARLLPVPQNRRAHRMANALPIQIFHGLALSRLRADAFFSFVRARRLGRGIYVHPLGAVFYFGLWGALVLGVLAMLRCRRVNFRKPNSQRALMIASGTYAAAMIIVWLIRLSGILPYPPHF